MAKFDWGNVKAVYKAPFQKDVGIQIRGASDKVNKIASPILQTITGAAVIGSALYGGAKGAALLAPKTAAVASGAAASGAAATAAKGGALVGTLKTAGIGAAAGFLAATGFKSGNLRQNNDTPFDAPTTQGTTSDINQDAFLDGTGDWGDVTGGRDVTITANRYLRTSQDVYNYQIPTQTATPTLSTYQGQTASNNDFLIPALIIGAVLLFK